MKEYSLKECGYHKWDSIKLVVYPYSDQISIETTRNNDYFQGEMLEDWEMSREEVLTLIKQLNIALDYLDNFDPEKGDPEEIKG